MQAFTGALSPPWEEQLVEGEAGILEIQEEALVQTCKGWKLWRW